MGKGREKFQRALADVAKKVLYTWIGKGIAAVIPLSAWGLFKEKGIGFLVTGYWLPGWAVLVGGSLVVFVVLDWIGRVWREQERKKREPTPFTLGGMKWMVSANFREGYQDLPVGEVAGSLAALIAGPFCATCECDVGMMSTSLLGGTAGKGEIPKLCPECGAAFGGEVVTKLRGEDVGGAVEAGEGVLEIVRRMAYRQAQKAMRRGEL